MKKNILVFAPHPDDEILGCGGTIAKRSSEGYKVIIVILTDGRHVFSKVLGINFDPTPEELRQIRKEETIRAAKTLGIPRKNLLFLDFEDETLEKYEKEAEEMILDIIKRYLPVEVYFPYIKDYNPDHQATNRIVKRCLKELRLTTIKFQYSVIQKYARIGPLIEKLVNTFKKHIVEINISEFLNLKEKAFKEFKSQISIISKKQKKPIIERARAEKFLTNKEKFYVDKNNLYRSAKTASVQHDLSNLILTAT